METTFIVKRTVLWVLACMGSANHRIRHCGSNTKLSCRGSLQSSTVKACSCNVAEKVSSVQFTINDFINDAKYQEKKIN